MATISWVGSGGNWNTGADWSTGSPPGPGDDAVVANGGTVTETTSIAVNSLTISGTSFQGVSTVDIEATGNVVTVSGNVTDLEGFYIDRTSGGGGSNVRIGGTLTVSGGFGVYIGNSSLSCRSYTGCSSEADWRNWWLQDDQSPAGAPDERS